MNTNILINDFVDEFKKLKVLAESAVSQLREPELLFTKPASESNSVAIIMKHVGGNLKSRWQDFLTTDGEKPGRNRDLEYIVTPDDSRDSIFAIWEIGWEVLFLTLNSLKDSDLSKEVFIRAQPLSVHRALTRSLAHKGYHVGQIVYLCRLLVRDDWKWLTIAPGESEKFNLKMRS